MLWYSKNTDNISESASIWVLDSDVEWVGDLGQIIEKLQLTNNGLVDYQACGCIRLDEYYNFTDMEKTFVTNKNESECINRNESNRSMKLNSPKSTFYSILNQFKESFSNSSVKTSNTQNVEQSQVFSCFTGFVRYSSKMLKLMCNSLLGGNLIKSRRHAMTLAHKHSLTYLDFLDSAQKYFEGDSWQRATNLIESKTSTDTDYINQLHVSKQLFEEYENEYDVRSKLPLILPTRPVGILFRKIKQD
jgi:hypothetical protein